MVRTDGMSTAASRRSILTGLSLMVTSRMAIPTPGAVNWRVAGGQKGGSSTMECLLKGISFMVTSRMAIPTPGAANWRVEGVRKGAAVRWSAF
jgi:hypothetical protein